MCCDQLLFLRFKPFSGKHLNGQMSKFVSIRHDTPYLHFKVVINILTTTSCENLIKNCSDWLLALADPGLSPRDLRAVAERGTFGLGMTGPRQMSQ
jgi:hypothetical protein